MTTIRFQRRGRTIYSVEAIGHAGYAEAGEDIVCAAVSSAVRLTDILLEDILGLPLNQETDTSVPRIFLALPEDKMSSAAQDALQALLLHLKTLKKEYPEFINVLEV